MYCKDFEGPTRDLKVLLKCNANLLLIPDMSVLKSYCALIVIESEKKRTKVWIDGLALLNDKINHTENNAESK